MKKYLVAVLVGIILFIFPKPAEAAILPVTPVAVHNVTCNPGPNDYITAKPSPGYTSTIKRYSDYVVITFKATTLYYFALGTSYTVSTDKKTAVMKVREISPRCLAR